MPRLPVDALFGGVSTQPPTRRAPDQMEEALNALFSPARGTEKRPPTKYISALSSILSEAKGYHFIDRDPDERYLVVYGNNASEPLQVYAMVTNATLGFVAGEKLTVAYSDAGLKSYLQTTPGGLKFLTVTDTTFIANTGTTVAMQAADAANNYYANNSELGWLKPVASSGTFAGTATSATNTELEQVTTTNGQFVFADNDAPYDTRLPTIQQDQRKGYYKRNTKVGKIQAAASGAIDFEYERRWVNFVEDLPDLYRETAWVTPGTNDEIEDPGFIQVRDSSPGGPLGWYRGTKVAGKFVWAQFPQPETPNCYFDAETMPLQMQRTAATTFTISTVSWTERYNGDDLTNPLPSFVGKTITDIVLFRDRLVFASGENVVMSESGNYTNFFLTDYTDVQDSDRIDVSIATRDVQNIKHLVPFDGVLVIFSEGGKQFELRSDEQALSPSTATLVPSTNYPADNNIRPTTAGKALYFATSSAQPLRVYEYLLQNNRDAPNTAELVTAHVDKYIPSGAAGLASNEETRTLAVWHQTNKNTLYIYKYFYINQQKVQSAWGKWVLDADDQIEAAQFFGQALHLVVKHDTAGYKFYTIETERADDAGDIDYYPAVDHQVTLDGSSPTAGYTVVYDATLDTTTITAPWRDDAVIAGNAEYQLIHISGSRKGQIFNAISSTDSGSAAVLKFANDHTTGTYILGRKYTLDVTLSPPFFRDQQGIAFNRGRTNIVQVNVHFDRTGYFTVDVENPFGTRSSYPTTGKIVGGPTAIVGGSSLQTGKREFMVLAESGIFKIHLTNDSPTPSIFPSLEYTLHYLDRSA